jgi:hypothetical protein
MMVVKVIALVLALCAPLIAQEIDVQRPAGIPKPSGEIDNVGKKTGKDSFTLQYTIVNTDANDLNLAGIAPVTGSAPNNLIFTINEPALSTLGQNESTTFTVDIDPVDDGAFALNLNIASDDADENPYVIRVRGDTGSSDKDEDDCSTRDGGRAGLLVAAATISAVAVGLRLRRSRA